MEHMNVTEPVVKKTNSIAAKRMNVKMMVSVAMLGAVSIVLMLFEFPLWFAPPFYKLDFSEVPVLIGAFMFGPLAGMLIELIKILLNLIINGTITAGVGEAANFAIGCAIVIPAAMIYKRNKTRKSAIIGLTIGTIIMVIVGCFLNAYVLLPAYAKAFGSDIGGLVAAGTAVNGAIKNLSTFVLFGVAPFNLLKGVIVSIITIFLYKKLSVILRQDYN